MQTHGVVEVNDVVSDVCDGLKVIGIVFLPDTLHLQVQEEALYHRVVTAVALSVLSPVLI